MDTNYPLQNLSEVDAAIRRSPIAQVFCGHFHCEHTVVEDYALHVRPSAAFRVGLNETEINVSYGGIPLREIIVDGTSVSTQVIDFEKTAGRENSASHLRHAFTFLLLSNYQSSPRRRPDF